MDLPSVMLQLARDPALVAWRSTGTVIRVTPGLKVEKVFIEKPYRWIASFHDHVAQDWQYGLAENLHRQIQAQLEAQQSE